MGNCALKPKVLFDGGAPAPEEINDSLLEDHNIDAAKSLRNLLLQDMNEKKVKDDEKIKPKNMSVNEDLKAALADDKSLTKEVISPTIETTSSVVVKATSDDQKLKNEEAVREDKVIDVVTVGESETESKPVEVKEKLELFA